MLLPLLVTQGSEVKVEHLFGVFFLMVCEYVRTEEERVSGSETMGEFKK